MRRVVCILGVVVAIMTVGCVADVETEFTEDVGEAQYALGRCSKACVAGGDYLRRYCENVDLVPEGLRKTCYKFVGIGFRSCDNTPPDFQCYSACGNLQTFDEFCRAHHASTHCWNATINAHGQCKKVAPRR